MQTDAPPRAAPVPKKTRRRWYLLAGFLLLVLAVAVGYYLLSGWQRERELAALYAELDAHDPDWRWPDLVAAYTLPPEDENAALHALKVHELLQKTPLRLAARWENARPHPLEWRNARLADEHVQMLRAAFDKLDPQVLTEARKLKDLPHGRLPLENAENPFTMKIKVHELRVVMNLLQNDAVLRGAEGEDLDAAAQSCQALLNTAGAIGDHPTLISQLVRIAGQALAIAVIERTLAQGDVSEKELATLQKFVEREAANNPLHPAMRGERAASEQVIQLLKNGKATWSDIFNNGRTDIGDHVLDLFPGLLLRGHPDHLRTMNEAVHASQLPDRERLEAMEKQEDELRQNKNRVLLTGMLMPAVLKVATTAQRSRAQLRSTTVAIAAERYRLKQDHWPREIADLVKEGLLKEVSQDPYDGKPLRLKRTETGLIVYSIGPDRKDNDGKLDRNNPIAPDTDLGFELWDRKHRGAPPPALP